MKKFFLLLYLCLSAGILSAQIDRMHVVVLPGIDGFDPKRCNYEITNESQTVSLGGYWNESNAELTAIVTSALNASLCDWLTFEGISSQMIHEGSGYIYVTLLNFRASVNTSLEPRMVSFICSDYTGTALAQAGGIVQKGGGVDLDTYTISCTAEEVFPGERVQINMNGSQLGVSYSLRNGEQEVMRMEGTGGALSFTGGFGAGSFQVVAISGSDAKTMNGTVTLAYGRMIAEGTLACEAGEILIDQEGGTYECNCYILNYSEDLIDILDKCNAGECVTWDPAIRFGELGSNDGMNWYVPLIASPNLADTARVNTLILGPYLDGSDGITSLLRVVQQGLKRIEIFDVEGPDYVLEGESFNILLSGSQDSIIYRLLHNGQQVKELEGTGDRLVFTGLTEKGPYTVTACYKDRRVEMNGRLYISSTKEYIINTVRETIYADDGSERWQITNYDKSGKPVLYWENYTSNDEYLAYIVPFEYDEYGRKSKEYLPYTGFWTDVDHAISLQEEYYLDKYSSCVPYTSYEYLNEPDSKLYIRREASSELGFTNDETMTIFRSDKNSFESIKRFQLNGSTLTLNGTYPYQNLCAESVYAPENGYWASYYDAEDRLVAQMDNSEYGTYYIYDDLGLLRYVLPPEQDRLFTSGSRTLDQLRKYCYYYEYDEYQRVYKKYLPGAEPVIYLYDKRGRLALMQDGNMREQGRWLFTKYDVFDRPIITGFCEGTEAQHRTALENATVFFEQYEENSFILGGGFRYTDKTYPYIRYSGDCLTYTFYDHYNWSYSEITPFSTENAFGESRAMGVNGLPTAKLERIVKSDGSLGDWLTTTYYYNHKGQLLQQISDEYSGIKEYVAYRYDLRGNVTHKKIKHFRNGEAILAYDRYFEYDNSDRILTIKQQIMDDPGGLVTLASNTYDFAGRLIRKQLHNGTDVIDYKYNLTGRLLSAESAAFSYHLGYDEPSLPASTWRFDGNISEMRWQYPGKAERGYSYEYDNVQRLTAATFYEAGLDSDGRYNLEDVSYDLNGNLCQLLRRNGSGGILNNLTYSYGDADNENAISTVRDNNVTSATYRYDANGNMTYDGRRNLNISYNYLNLPSKIGDISYIYTTTGRKVGMQVGSSLTYYCGESVYDADGLLLVRHPEGFTKPIPWVKSVYYYTLRDHLGSTRVVREATAANQLTTVQTTEYYPFGLAFQYSELDKNKYLFSGKELQDAASGSGILNLYDFGARFYDPVLGRWTTRDPMEEKYYGLSAYSYAANNPIGIIDPNGEDLWIITHDGRMMLALVSDKNILYTLDKEGNINGAFMASDNDIFEQLNEVSSQREEFDREKMENVLSQKRKSIRSYDHQKEMLRLFLFLADNTEIEWSYAVSKDEKYIGVATSTKPADTQFAFKDKDIKMGMHSHVNTGDIADEYGSMHGDQVKRVNGIYTFDKYYVYMKNSGYVHKIDVNGYISFVRIYDLNNSLYKIKGIYKYSNPYKLYKDANVPIKFRRY